MSFQAPALQGAKCILGSLPGSHLHLCGKGVQISGWSVRSTLILLQLSLVGFVGGGKKMERVVVSCIRRCARVMFLSPAWLLVLIQNESVWQTCSAPLARCKK